MIPITTAITGIAVESIPKTDTGNDDRRRSGLSAFTQLLGRTIGLGSIIFRRTPDDDTYYQADYHGSRKSTSSCPTSASHRIKKVATTINTELRLVPKASEFSKSFIFAFSLVRTEKIPIMESNNSDSCNQHRSDYRLELHQLYLPNG